MTTPMGLARWWHFVGCIGAIGRNEVQQAVNAVGAALREMEIASGAPAMG